jgi:hypothetical protein
MKMEREAVIAILGVASMICIFAGVAITFGIGPALFVLGLVGFISCWNVTP